MTNALVALNNLAYYDNDARDVEPHSSKHMSAVHQHRIEIATSESCLPDRPTLIPVLSPRGTCQPALIMLSQGVIARFSPGSFQIGRAHV